MKLTKPRLIILALVLIILFCLRFSLKIRDGFSEKRVEIVVARYNENLEWLKAEPFNKYDVIIYNKGDNESFEKPSNVKRGVNLKNVGRESHTYLQHIIQNYDNLSDITIFLPGSNQMQNKMDMSLKLVKTIEETGNAAFIANETHENLKTALYDFKIDAYQSTNAENKTANPESKLKESHIRPYGRWFEYTFGDIVASSLVYCGVFSVAKEDILQHPLEYYKSLETQLSTSSNPEVGHYFERSWTAVFHPMNKTQIIV